MSSLPLIVLVVRDRPVGYQPGRFGVSLHAIERGYFPISHTGYRSLARGNGLENDPPPPLEFLEELAAANDRQTDDILRRTRKTLASKTPNGLAYFDLLLAVEYGFFASDADRVRLWRTAYMLADRILRDEMLQPNLSNLPAWSQETCDETMQRTRAMQEWLRQLLVGNITRPPQSLYPCFGSYWELPERMTPEPVIGIPEITSELSLDLPTIDTGDAGDVDDDVSDMDGEDAADVDDDQEDDAGDDRELEESSAAAGDSSQQLALF